MQKYTYWMWDRAIVKGKYKLVEGGPADPMGPGGTLGMGVLDPALPPDFRSGKFTLPSGKHLTAADKDKKQLLIEERLAKKNRPQGRRQDHPDRQRRKDHGRLPPWPASTGPAPHH